MATLISVYDNNGCVGRCDARCYEAQHPECDCVCGGANHGVGYKQAVQNTRAMAIDQLESCCIDSETKMQIAAAINQIDFLDTMEV